MKTMKYIETNAMGILFALAILELAVAAHFASAALLPAPDRKEAAPLHEYADIVLAKCRGESYRPGCYDKEVPKLMDFISMEDAFRVTSLIQDRDNGYRYCHVLGHELSAREVQKDPEKWKEVVTRCPSGVCSNGCIHGGFQERFRAETFTPAQIEAVKPDLTTLCEQRNGWQPTGLEQASCYHAIGHLSMYLTNAEIRQSTAICDEVSKKPDGRDYSHLCYDGAFMQIFQPLEPEDFALVKGKEVTRDMFQDFCNSFTGIARESCWTEAWPLFIEELRRPGGIVAHCAGASDRGRDRCYSSLIYVLTAQMGLDVGRTKDFCGGMPAERQGICFSNAASRFVEIDYRFTPEAVAVCGSASAEADRDRCYKELAFYSTYNFRRGSPQAQALCAAMPEPWRTECTARQQ